MNPAHAMNRIDRRLALTTLLLGAAVAMSPAAAAPAKVAAGAYECWGNGAPRMLLNFNILDDSRYGNEDGNERGAFGYDSAGGRITFKGGHLDGAMPNGFTAIYHEPKGRPTVSFRSARGAEASFCERVKR